jgi:protoporphyrinogen oxidase
MYHSVVVGGGVCGLLAAYLLRQYGHEVVLIEQSEHCGGLLRSVQDEQGNYYDQGTHVPNPTGIEMVDEFLFGPESQRHIKWNDIPHLKTGNYFKGQWDLETQTIDARKLSQTSYEKGMGQLFINTEKPEDSNIEDYCKNSIGETFFTELVKPVIDKLYGPQEDYKKLSAKNSINYFGATRLLALDEAMTAKLKEIAAYDERLGFHTHAAYQAWMESQGIIEPAYLYPKSKKGCQAWVDALIDKVTASGVKVINGSGITGLNVSNSKISEVSLNNGEVFKCDWLYWSVPPAFALKFLVSKEQGTSDFRPSLRTANIFHYTIDRPLNNTQSHYLWNWDSSSDIFRITLYPNLNKSREYSITAEVLSDAEQAKDLDSQRIFSDLKSMDLVTADANITSSYRQIVHHTFPIPTIEFNHHVVHQFEQLTHSINNISVSGRFSGKLWLLNEILQETYQSIHNQFGSTSE